MTLPPDFLPELQKHFAGEVRTDFTTRLLYSTDASMYQIEPLAVAFPRQADDLAAAAAICAAYQVPLLARGAGSSLAGQAVGAALVLDCSRYLNRILAIDPQARQAVVEPGVIVNTLNRAAARHGLQFGPDPASADRATVGGSVANNATGAHSIVYGMAADHLVQVEAVLADGSLVHLKPVSLETAGWLAQGQGREAELYAAALRIHQEMGDIIRRRWPRTWRCASGYTLNYLIPWTAAHPPRWSSWAGDSAPYPPIPTGEINLAPLLAGSEGTLALMRSITLNLVPRPAHTVLAVLAYPSLEAACDDAPRLLEHAPSAVELIPNALVRMARAAPAYAGMVKALDALYTSGREPAALLAVEFAGEHLPALERQAQALGGSPLLALDPEHQRSIWNVRKVGLGLLTAQPSDFSAPSFIEDLSVPVEHLGAFVRALQGIFAEHGAQAEFYAHASAGCLHIRTLMDLKTQPGIDTMRSLAREAVELALGLGGAASGEHGDGLARGEWLERTFGPEITGAFRDLKQAADPLGLLNPGKVVDPPRMDQNLRYGPSYRAQGWQPALTFTHYGAGETGLVRAIEQCNGAGVCRQDSGVMCPSFQATRDEMHSTRGRANLLRALISGAFPTEKLGEQAVREALDLCLACKGCQAECPSGVDVARLKYEFTHRYHQTHRRRLRDYLFGYFGALARWGAPMAPLANRLTRSALFRGMGERALGLAGQRPFPALARQTLTQQARRMGLLKTTTAEGERVLFLTDAFTEYVHPAAGLAALRALAAAGCQPVLLPVMGAGRTLISKGFVEAARRQAQKVIAAIEAFDPQAQMAVVGVEPSEIYTLRDEYADLLAGEEWAARQEMVARRAYMIDEFLVRPGKDGLPRISQLGQRPPQAVLLHAHCYQKAQPPATDGFPSGAAATVAMLQAAGCTVGLIDAGCCGMAGAFGYEAEHYALSMQIGEQRLFPAVRAAAPGTRIAACGASCQPQIVDGTGREAVHPIQLLFE